MTFREKLQKGLAAPLHWSLITLTGLGVIDGVGTSLGLLYNVIEEANPFMNWVITHGGILGFLITKLFIAMVTTSVLHLVPFLLPPERQAKIGNGYTILALVLYGSILTLGVVSQFF